MQDKIDSNEWDIKIPTEGNLESKVRAIERQLANQMKEFVFILDLEGNNLFRAKGGSASIPSTKELQEILRTENIIIITHNHPLGDLTFSEADLDTFYLYKNISQLRATTGTRTAILDISNRNNSYFIEKQRLRNRQQTDLRKKLITIEDYEIWNKTLLSKELVKILDLEIKNIDL